MNTQHLPVNFYQELYEKIIDEDFRPEDLEDITCACSLELSNNINVEVDATFEVNLIDNSFDHAFGTEHVWDLEVGQLKYITVYSITQTDEETNEVVSLKHLFSYTTFWMQFKSFCVRKCSHLVKYGDVVLAKTWSRGRWEKAIFLYKDLNTLRYCCASRVYHGKFVGKSSYYDIVPFSPMFERLERKYKSI